MKVFAQTLPMMVCLMASNSFAVDGGKAKVIDNFHALDPKTVKLVDIKAKSVTTSDPAHHKVLEMVSDFAKADVWPRVEKSVLTGAINPKKYSAFRFFVRSDSATQMDLHMMGGVEKDGRPVDFYVRVPATETWTEVTVPLKNFKNYEWKIFKNGVQQVFKGGEPITDVDFEKINRVAFVFGISFRGTATQGHYMVDGFSLVEQ